jgi:hypothetical protein
VLHTQHGSPLEHGSILHYQENKYKNNKHNIGNWNVVVNKQNGKKKKEKRIWKKTFYLKKKYQENLFICTSPLHSK